MAQNLIHTNVGVFEYEATQPPRLLAENVTDEEATRITREYNLSRTSYRTFASPTSLPPHGDS